MRLLSLISALHPRFEGDSGGGTGGTGTGNPNPADERPNIQGLMQRHNNDAMGVITTLLTENYGHRDRIRQLQGQLPAQGATVLSAEQAAQWTAYQALGAPDALTTQLQGAQTSQAELARLQRERMVASAAEAAGYKASVLSQLPGADKLTFEVREADVDGKKVKHVFVKDGDKETPLADHAKNQWADFLPALQAQQTQTQTPPAGTTFPRQDAGGGQPANPVDAYAQRMQAQRDAAPSPFAPKPATPSA
jgi:hypothetical protein